MLPIKFTPKTPAEYRKEMNAASPKKVRDAVSPKEWQTVQARIATYLEANGAADKTGVSPFPRTTKAERKTRKIAKSSGDHLFDAYDGGSIACEDIKSRPKAYPVDQLGGHCPYCGILLEVGASRQSPDRDHFLPRSVYPELSLVDANLVSSCGPCNNLKLARALTKSGGAMFIHPYFEPTLAKRLVSAVVNDASGDPVFEFTVDSGTPVAVSHFDELELGERWASYAGLGFAKSLRFLQQSLSEDGDLSGVRRELEVQVAHYEGLEQPNSPDAVLFRALFDLTDDELGALLEQSNPFKNAESR